GRTEDPRLRRHNPGGGIMSRLVRQDRVIPDAVAERLELRNLNEVRDSVVERSAPSVPDVGAECSEKNRGSGREPSLSPFRLVRSGAMAPPSGNGAVSRRGRENVLLMTSSDGGR